MTLTIDTPVSVHVRPASDGRKASCSVDMLGGSLWFADGSYPASVRDGSYPSAVVEVGLRVFRVGDRMRSVFSPVRLVSVGK